MKAVVWTGENNFQVQDVPAPQFGPAQILVQVHAAAVCTTDFHYPEFKCVPPIVPGHEAAGTVVQIGRQVTTVKVGQRVTLDPVQRCGRCSCCIGGYGHLCLNTRHLGDTDIPGGWAEYVAIDAQNAYPLPEDVDFRAAALSEPAAVCLESFLRGNFQKGQTALILGDGPFGFIHAMIARILGAEKIIVAGHYKERLARIEAKTGALTCNTHQEDLASFLKIHKISPGVDLAIEATGATAAPNLGLRALRPRGSLIIFSLVWEPEILDLGLISMKELNVLGSCRSLKCFEKCIEWMSQGLLDLGDLVDIEAPLEKIKEAMDLLKTDKRNRFKAVLLPQM